MKTWLRAGRWAEFGLVWLLTMVGGWRIVAQSVTTTSVQGIVYLANGAPGSGTLL